MATVRVSRELITEAMRSDAVRAGIAEKARKIAGEVDQVGAGEGVRMNAQVRDLTRPGGRPESRVESEQVDQEWGSRYSERRRIMGRVGEKHRNRPAGRGG